MSKKRLLAIILSLVMVLSLIPQISFADEGDEEPTPPPHGKYLTDNGDGTMQLELAVTGDADTDVEVSAANILVVFDTSNSMTSYRADGTNGNPNNSHPSRADVAENIIRQFAHDLFGYKNGEDRWLRMS